MPRKPTLRDVAQTSGVHVSTVSLALRDHPRIPAGTRTRVKAAADRLGYRIDPLVSSLIQSRRSSHPTSSPQLAFLAPKPAVAGGRAAAPDFFAGALRRAGEFGFRLDRFGCVESGRSELQLSDHLSVRRVHGIIVDHCHSSVSPPALAWERFSAVAVGGSTASSALHHVAENFFDAACQALERCRDRGYRRLGLVRLQPPQISPLSERALAACPLQQFHAPPLAPALCPGEPPTFAAFAAWLSSHRPDALLVDRPGLVLKWLLRLGLEPSQRPGVVGLERQRTPGCAGYSFDPAVTGALAVEMLLDLMHRRETNLPAQAHQILLQGRWTDGVTLPPRA